MVQSARVNQFVKGDDAVLTHQLMKSVAYNAELSRAPDVVSANDIVTFFYAMQDPSLTDLVGYTGVVVGSYPASLFTVQIPGEIPAGPDIERGTKVLKSGNGQTVRAEIDRQVLATTGDTAVDSPILANVASLVGLKNGQSVSGPGIPAGAIIISVGVTTVVISINATATAPGIGLRFGTKETQYLIDEVDVFERGFPSSLTDTSGGVAPPYAPPNLT